MEKEFISYEQALALKELGFDDKCFGAYDKKYKLAISTSDYWDKSSLYSLNDYFGKNNYRCLAPLYQQAFRWFREKYNLISVVGYHNLWKYSFLIETIEEHKTIIVVDKINTYKEAELECLKKLIEIVKEKS
jgi:hypothetical protein